MPELIIQSGKHQGKKLVLPDVDVTVGRDEDCQIRLATNDVSRKHCVLRTTASGLVLRDLDSRNGTLVNDVRIETERLLVPGDVVRIGPIVLEVPGAKPVDKPPVTVSRETAAASASIHSASADDIASWLTEDEDVDGSGTTTIIPRAPAAADAEEDSSAEVEIPTDYEMKATAPGTGEPEPKKKKFKSIAAEAAHIIGCWNELLARDEA